MNIKVDVPPENSHVQVEYYSESGARKYRRNFLRFNSGQYGTHRVKAKDVVIYCSGSGWGKGWEVWVKDTVI